MDPENNFTFGCDYRVPIMHGLLDKTFINGLKTSPSYDEASFAREYMSLWSGANDDSWFNFDKLSNYRKLKNPETHAKTKLPSNQFYLLSVDVGRLHDQTVVSVFHVYVNQDRYSAALVNILVLGREATTKTFRNQAIDIKRLIQIYNPREVVIDTNGLGVGLGDEMIQVQLDDNGVEWPAYGFFNDDNYRTVQPKGVKQILYGIKANGPLKSKIHGNVYSKLNSGSVRFLIKEQEAKSALLATQIGQRMDTEQRVKRLMPHEMTTKLFEEMANLRLKKTGGTLDIVLEQINPRFPDDKYFSFAYGMWRIKELEEESYKKKHRFSGKTRQLVFFTGG